MSKSRTTAATKPLLIAQNSVSKAWAQALLYVLDHPGTEIAPLILSIDCVNGQYIDDPSDPVYSALDAVLSTKGRPSIENVAFTIFPERYRQIVGGDRNALFDLYRRSFPRMQERKKSLNGRGLYFQRMIMYDGAPCNGNQLEWILSQYQKRTSVRRSMLQATVFDARKDHVASAQLGFPCLQHVSFEPTTAGLVLNAFYATQQLFDKAYGNYLGLLHLGQFMAAQMGTALVRLNVMVGVAKLERITKSDPALKQLVAIAKALVENHEPAQTLTQ
ncbi:thymidylate synthase family protein [Ponticaulis koreensis]|uniref:hypothetical protein n=1 Tax=Ponticaulis koreensis TaxID=1123045 RepID=UPI0003B48097|nr:hypothetical protein [Ponticaulis koreensis]